MLYQSYTFVFDQMYQLLKYFNKLHLPRCNKRQTPELAPTHPLTC